MTRLDDWEVRLVRILDLWRDRPFAWGKADCVHFAGIAFYALTGERVTADIDCYANERTALKVLADIAPGGLVQAVEIATGLKADYLRQPVRGDIVMALRPVVGDVAGRTGPGLGVSLGDRAAFVGVHGLEEIPIEHCLCSWKI